MQCILEIQCNEGRFEIPLKVKICDLRWKSENVLALEEYSDVTISHKYERYDKMLFRGW